jgi:hypothetical protein
MFNSSMVLDLEAAQRLKKVTYLARSTSPILNKSIKHLTGWVRDYVARQLKEFSGRFALTRQH